MCARSEVRVRVFARLYHPGINAAQRSLFLSQEEMAAIYRGSLVVYKEKLFYFQPNGTSCYLFETRESVGNQELRKHAAPRVHVRLATEEDKKRYAGTLHSHDVPRVPIAAHPIVPFTEEEKRVMQYLDSMTASIELSPASEGDMRAHLIIGNTFRVPPPPAKHPGMMTDEEFRAADAPATKPLREATSSRGAFIVLEGIDRAGKTTQARLLVDGLHAAGIDAVAYRFPARTRAIGGLLDSYLQQTRSADAHVMHLLFAADRWEQQAALRADLLTGKTVVCDRYAYSGVVYSAAKGLDLEWCKAADRGELRPDLVVYLDLPPEAASLRAGYGVELYEHVDFQRIITSKYALMSSDYEWAVVDARGQEELVQARIYEHVLRAVTRIKDGNTPLREDLFTD
jgi:dTMP kinase